MNRDSSLKATSKFFEQSQLPIINGKGNGQLMDKKKGQRRHNMIQVLKMRSHQVCSRREYFASQNPFLRIG